MSDDIIFLTMEDIMRATTLSRRSIYRLVKEGDFPPSTKLKGIKRCVWNKTDIDNWKAERMGYRPMS